MATDLHESCNRSTPAPRRSITVRNTPSDVLAAPHWVAAEVPTCRLIMTEGGSALEHPHAIVPTGQESLVEAESTFPHAHPSNHKYTTDASHKIHPHS